MAQIEQQHITPTMTVEIVDNGIHAFDVLRYPSIDFAQKINPVDDGASIVGACEGSTCERTKCSKDIALAASSVVCLLPRSLSAWHDLDPWITAGAFRTHLIQT